jgi:pimeloyl-ACP methyl ester carboxylesterase
VSVFKSPAGESVVMALYDRALAQWPVPFEELHAGTRHGDTFAIVSGEVSAPPLVLLHGASSNAVSWIGDIAEYSRCFRVYAVDLIGEPGRSSPNRPAWDGPAYAEWLEDFLNAFSIRSTSLLGISQGGWTALKFATSRPERVERLVLLAPGGVTTARASFILRAVLLSNFGRRGGEAINRIVLGRHPMHKDAVAFMDAIMAHTNPRIGALPLFTDEELKRLTMPILLLAGAQDALYPSAGTVARMRSLVPRLTATLLPEAGHVLVNLASEIMPFLTAPVGATS